MQLKKLTFDVKLDIENLFDIDYQKIAYYPMPGRTILVSVTSQLLK